MLFVWRGSVLKLILPSVGTAVLVAVIVTLGVERSAWRPGLTVAPFSLLGIALAIFLGFRNNASYERFWEARRLWGALLNDTRSLARQILTLSDGTATEQRNFVYVLIAFTHALRHQLRGTDATDSLRPLLQGCPPGTAERVGAAHYKPAVLLLIAGEELAALRRQAKLEPILASTFEPGLAALSGVLGGCERISNTPLPFTYSVIIHRVIYLFVFLLPFGLVETAGWWTPVMVGFVAYMFLSLETLSDEIEEPFGTKPNDLALDAMSATIEATLRELLGEEPVPPAPATQQYYLT